MRAPYITGKNISNETEIQVLLETVLTRKLLPVDGEAQGSLPILTQVLGDDKGEGLYGFLGARHSNVILTREIALDVDHRHAHPGAQLVLPPAGQVTLLGGEQMCPSGLRARNLSPCPMGTGTGTGLGM